MFTFFASATLLRLLAGQLFPSEYDPLNSENNRLADIFVPPHIRVVQIQETPLIFGPSESIYDNLTFGITSSSENDLAGLEKRAYTVMRKLGFNEPMLASHLKTPNVLGVDGINITRAERQLLSIGRALLLNPEMIVAYKPTALLSDAQSERVMQVIREFVANRGVAMDPNEPMILRRKRTFIFSAKIENAAKHADAVYEARAGKLLPLETKEQENISKKAPKKSPRKALSKSNSTASAAGGLEMV